MHNLIIRYADGEMSTEGEYTDRAQALLEAYVIVARLHVNEHVFVLGYIIPGSKAVQ